MPLINLIQEQRIAIRRSGAKARAYFLMFTSVAVASVGSYAFLTFETERAQGEASHLKNQLRRNEPLVAQIDFNTKEIGTLSPRLKTLSDAQVWTDRWSRILHHIATQTPANAWLTSIRASVGDPTKPVNISFLGVADSQTSIGEYMERLQNCSDLDAVTFRNSQEKPAATYKGIEFEFGADVSGTAEQKKVEEDKS